MIGLCGQLCPEMTLLTPCMNYGLVSLKHSERSTLRAMCIHDLRMGIRCRELSYLSLANENSRKLGIFARKLEGNNAIILSLFIVKIRENAPMMLLLNPSFLH